MPKLVSEETFLAKIDRSSGPSSCWPYLGGLDLRGGYGVAWWGGKRIKAHRLAYQLATGKSVEGLHVCHQCDNPKCCNPAHLFLGSNLDNHVDMVNKRRHCFGEKSPIAKLTDEDAKDIVASSVGTVALAKKYGVSPALISGVRHGNRWKHVGEIS